MKYPFYACSLWIYKLQYTITRVLYFEKALQLNFMKYHNKVIYILWSLNADPMYLYVEFADPMHVEFSNKI